MNYVRILLILTVLSLGTVSAASLLHPAPAAPSGKYFDYSVTILMENNDLPSVLSQGSFQASLASQYTLSTGYSAVSHPSEPNYSAMISGHITPNTSDGVCCGQDTGSNIIDSLEFHGLTWKAFAEGLTNGDCGGSGVDTDHFPFLYFSDITNNPSRCSSLLGATAGSDPQLISALNAGSGWPNYVWLTPNTSNDAHDTSIAFGDSYLAGVVPQILSSGLFRNQRAVLFVVYDEGNDVSCSSGGADCVYASWSGRVTKTGFTSSNSYSHYSYLHTIEDNWGLPTLTSNDASAPVMSEFFASSASTSLSTSFTISPVTAQVGQTVAFTASPLGGTSPYTDSWSFGDGSSGSGGTVTHTYSATGTFQVTLSTQDSASPASTVRATKTLSIDPAPLPGSLGMSISSTPTTPASGQTVTFRAAVTGGSPPYGVGWDFGDGGISVGLSTTHVFSGSGTFNVTAAVTDSGTPAHTAVTSLSITVGTGTSSPPGLSAQFTFNPINPIVGDSASFTSSVSGGAAPYGYAWNFGDSVGSATAANPSYSFSSAGTFTVTLTVTDSGGATVAASHDVTVTASAPPPPPANGSSGQYCSSLSTGPAGDLEPTVSVDYVNPGNSANFATNALFDTGATYSLAPSSLATALGLTLTDGTHVTLTGVGGTQIQAYVFHLTLNFGGTLKVVNVPVAFTDSTNQFLIGRLGFLNQVTVTLDSSGHTICFNAASGTGGAGGTGCGGAGEVDGDGDYDGDHCGDTGDSGSGDDDGGNSDEDFLGVFTGTSGQTVSGLPMLFTMVPLIALAGIASVEFVRVPLRIRSRAKRN